MPTIYIVEGVDYGDWKALAAYQVRAEAEAEVDRLTALVSTPGADTAPGGGFTTFMVAECELRP